MSKNFLAHLDKVAVSAYTKETAINTEQTLDVSFLVEKSTIISLDGRRESNADELTGLEEPDAIYNLGSLSSVGLNFPKAQPQHFAFGYSFALGTSTPGEAGTGYKHAITPVTGMDLPSFTAGMQLGETILKRRFASMFVDQLVATFAKDAWAKLALTCKGTGKYTDNILKETVTENFNATTLTLAANGVQGATEAARLDNVHYVRVLDPVTGEKQEVTVTAVSDASPAVLTINAPGESFSPDTTYEVIYVPTEPAWCTFPARLTETPLRVTDLVVTLGGKWTGSAFLGGKTMAAELESIEHTINNDVAIEFRVGGTGSYANYMLRKGRSQTLKLNRQMRDFILQQHLIDGDYFAVYMKATGAEYDSTSPGYDYFVEVIFPRCAVLNAPISVGDKVLAEAGDLVVLQDATYGSVIVNVQNKQAAYAA